MFWSALPELLVFMDICFFQILLFFLLNIKSSNCSISESTYLRNSPNFTMSISVQRFFSPFLPVRIIRLKSDSGFCFILFFYHLLCNLHFVRLSFSLTVLCALRVVFSTQQSLRFLGPYSLFQCLDCSVLCKLGPNYSALEKKIIWAT